MIKRMHCQDELEEHLKQSWDDIELIEAMFDERYSTSKHLFVLYSLVRGLKATRVGEVGVGRSSLALRAGAFKHNGRVIYCDRYDYRDLLKIPDNATFIIGDASKFYSHPEVLKGIDFMFLDYMSTIKKSVESCYKDLKRAIKLLPTNGMIAVHDAFNNKYNVAAALEKLKGKYGNKIEVLTLPFCSGLGLIRNKMPSKYGKLTDQWPKK